MWDLIDKYSWIEGPEVVPAWTAAVISDTTTDAVVRLYGGDPASALAACAFHQADVPDDDFGKYFHLQVHQHQDQDQVIAIENNGWTGTIPEIARRGSATGGHFFSVYWSPSGDRIVEAMNGVVTAYLNPGLYDPDATFDVNPPWIEPQVLESFRIAAISLAHLEQQTGVEFQESWLHLPLPVYRIPDPDWLFRDVPDARAARPGHAPG